EGFRRAAMREIAPRGKGGLRGAEAAEWGRRPHLRPRLRARRALRHAMGPRQGHRLARRHGQQPRYINGLREGAVPHTLCADRGEGRHVAIEWHLELLKEFPRDLMSLKRAQLICFYSGRLDTSLKFVEQVLPENQDQNYIYGMLAFPLLELGRIDEAERAARKGLAINKNGCWSQHNLCHVFQQECHFKEATELMKSSSPPWEANPRLVARRCLLLGRVSLMDTKRQQVMQKAIQMIGASDEQVDVFNAGEISNEPFKSMGSLSIEGYSTWLLPPPSELHPEPWECSSSSLPAWNVISSNRPCSSAQRLQPRRAAAAEDDMKSTSEPQDDDDDDDAALDGRRQFLLQAESGASESSSPSSVAGPGLQPGTSAATLPSIISAMRVTSWSVMSSSATISAATLSEPEVDAAVLRPPPLDRDVETCNTLTVVVFLLVEQHVDVVEPTVIVVTLRRRSVLAVVVVDAVRRQAVARHGAIAAGLVVDASRLMQIVVH
ncbi:hypothetical protein ABZP36_001775, partial [Zizania latifolia]